MRGCIIINQIISNFAFMEVLHARFQIRRQAFHPFHDGCGERAARFCRGRKRRGKPRGGRIAQRRFAQETGVRRRKQAPGGTRRKNAPAEKEKTRQKAPGPSAPAAAHRKAHSPGRRGTAADLLRPPAQLLAHVSGGIRGSDGAGVFAEQHQSGDRSAERHADGVAGGSGKLPDSGAFRFERQAIWRPAVHPAAANRHPELRHRDLSGRHGRQRRRRGALL